MTHPTLDPRPKTASDWRCPWQQLEPQLILPLSLSALSISEPLSLYHSILSGYFRAGLRKHVDLAHISLHRVGRHKESRTVSVCLQRQHTSQSQIPPTLQPQHPSPSAQIHILTPHLTPWWVADIQTSRSENEMLTYLLLFHHPLLGLLMAPESTWPKEWLSPASLQSPFFFNHCRIINN